MTSAALLKSHECRPGEGHRGTIADSEDLSSGLLGEDSNCSDLPSALHGRDVDMNVPGDGLM